MKFKFSRLIAPLMLVSISLVTMGCGAIAQTLILGVGKSATKEDTGFFSSYDNLQEGTTGYPDYYYKDLSVNWSKYKTIAVPDYSSLTKNSNSTSGLQISEYKNLRQDLPDTMCHELDGSIFKKCKRIPERLDPKNYADIKKILADVILMGNIKEFRQMDKLTVTQLEIKIIEIKTGKEIFKMIDRKIADHNKVAMPSVIKLTKMLNMANESSAEADQPKKSPAPTVDPVESPASPVAQPVEKTVSRESAPSVAPQSSTSGFEPMVVKESKTKLRSKPSTKATAVRTLKKGETVQVIKHKEGWCLIQVSGDETGWCLKSALVEK